MNVSLLFSLNATNTKACVANLFYVNPRNLEVEQNTNLGNRVGQIASDAWRYFFSQPAAPRHWFVSAVCGVGIYLWVQSYISARAL